MIIIIIVVLTLYLLFALSRLFWGIVFLLKSPKKILEYKLSKVKNKYKIKDTGKYLSNVGKSYLLESLIFIVGLIILFFFKTIYSNIIVLAFSAGIIFIEKGNAELIQNLKS